MHILIVDDEPLARSRLRHLLGDCASPADPWVLSEAANASQAMAALRSQPPVQLVLLDIQMPGTSGMSLAFTLQQLPEPPLLIFVTAHSHYAAQAFDVQACDYLTKPVRLERLQQALAKARKLLQQRSVLATPHTSDATLAVTELGQTLYLPLAQIAFIQAELKTLTVHTSARSYVLDGSLNELEQRFGHQLLRVHRSFLANPSHINRLQRWDAGDNSDAWCLHLHSVAQVLPVSRRQLSHVRQAIAQARV